MVDEGDGRLICRKRDAYPVIPANAGIQK